eukprot:m.255783 g.255783  ORF g.255783 m.255783 type:complete len:63 (-) comp26562_c0_seq7:148-336(-)
MTTHREQWRGNGVPEKRMNVWAGLIDSDSEEAFNTPEWPEESRTCEKKISPSVALPQESTTG